VWHLHSRPATGQRTAAGNSDPPCAVGEQETDSVIARLRGDHLSSERCDGVDVGTERVLLAHHEGTGAGQSSRITGAAIAQTVANHAQRLGGERATPKGVEPAGVIGRLSIESIERARLAVQRVALRLISFVHQHCAVTQRNKARETVGAPTRIAGRGARFTPQRGRIDGKRDHFPLFVRPVRIDDDRERRVAARRTCRRDEQR